LPWTECIHDTKPAKKLPIGTNIAPALVIDVILGRLIIKEIDIRDSLFAMGFDSYYFHYQRIDKLYLWFQVLPDFRLLTKQTFFYNFSIVGGQKVKKG
jgi:hypothetical protein